MSIKCLPKRHIIYHLDVFFSFSAEAGHNQDNITAEFHLCKLVEARTVHSTEVYFLHYLLLFLYTLKYK